MIRNEELTSGDRYELRKCSRERIVHRRPVIEVAEIAAEKLVPRAVEVRELPKLTDKLPQHGQLHFHTPSSELSTRHWQEWSPSSTSTFTGGSADPSSLLSFLRSSLSLSLSLNPSDSPLSLSFSRCGQSFVVKFCNHMGSPFLIPSLRTFMPGQPGFRYMKWRHCPRHLGSSNKNPTRFPNFTVEVPLTRIWTICL